MELQLLEVIEGGSLPAALIAMWMLTHRLGIRKQRRNGGTDHDRLARIEAEMASHKATTDLLVNQVAGIRAQQSTMAADIEQIKETLRPQRDSRGRFTSGS